MGFPFKPLRVKSFSRGAESNRVFMGTPLSVSRSRDRCAAKCGTWRTQQAETHHLGPHLGALLSPFLGQGSPSALDYSKKVGTLVLTSQIWRT